MTSLGGIAPSLSGGSAVPLDAVSEYQVLLAPFDVRYGRLRAHERVLDLRAGAAAVVVLHAHNFAMSGGNAPGGAGPVLCDVHVRVVRRAW